jgi:hypothetical protein
MPVDGKKTQVAPWNLTSQSDWCTSQKSDGDSTSKWKVRSNCLACSLVSANMLHHMGALIYTQEYTGTHTHTHTHRQERERKRERERENDLKYKGSCSLIFFVTVFIHIACYGYIYIFIRYFLYLHFKCYPESSLYPPPTLSPTHPLPLLGPGIPLYWGI